MEIFIIPFAIIVWLAFILYSREEERKATRKFYEGDKK